VGTVRGLATEARRVHQAFESVQPAAVALGVGPEDLDGLRQVLKGAAYEHDYSFADELYEHVLRTFGEVSLPPQDLVEAVQLADERGIPVMPIDLPEPAYVDLFTSSIGAFALLRYQRRLKRIARKARAPPTAMEWHLAWDRELTRLRGFALLERGREEAMAKCLAGFPHQGRILVLLEAARVEGVLRNLENLQNQQKLRLA
jgi:pheromone shutdown protein TraB